MSSNPFVTEGYSSHVRECQARWEKALEAEGFDDAVIHSGSEIYSFLDDYHYPFRPNPHFLQWLPLTRHHDSVLHVRPGEKAKLYYYQPDDYWYLPPSDPASWWASEFDIETVTDPNAWKPFGSVKFSGQSREGSKYGIEAYLEIKCMCFENIV